MVGGLQELRGDDALLLCWPRERCSLDARDFPGPVDPPCWVVACYPALGDVVLSRLRRASQNDRGSTARNKGTDNGVVVVDTDSTSAWPSPRLHNNLDDGIPAGLSVADRITAVPPTSDDSSLGRKRENARILLWVER